MEEIRSRKLKRFLVKSWLKKKRFEQPEDFGSSDTEIGQLLEFYDDILRKYGSNFQRENDGVNSFVFVHKNKGFLLSLPKKIYSCQHFRSVLSIDYWIECTEEDSPEKIRDELDQLIIARDYVQRRGYPLEWTITSPTCLFKAGVSTRILVYSRSGIAKVVMDLNE